MITDRRVSSSKKMKVDRSQQNAKINSDVIVKFFMCDFGIILYIGMTQVKIHIPSRFAQYIHCLAENPPKQVVLLLAAYLF